MQHHIRLVQRQRGKMREKQFFISPAMLEDVNAMIAKGKRSEAAQFIHKFGTPIRIQTIRI